VQIVTGLGPADPDRPSGYGLGRAHTRNDGQAGVLTRPIGGSLIPPSGRGQVAFTPLAGGVS
jgi:hypothetical protein